MARITLNPTELLLVENALKDHLDVAMEMAADRSASLEDRVTNIEYATDVHNLLRRFKRVKRDG